MALIPCKECGAKISELARACPRCGYPNETPVERLGIDAVTHKKDMTMGWGAVAIGLVIVIGFWASGQIRHADSGPAPGTRLYEVVESRPPFRILLVNPGRSENDLRRLGDQLTQDFAPLAVVTAVVFDDPNAATLFDRMSAAAGSIDESTDAFYDRHMVANYAKHGAADHYRYTMWPTGARGKQIDLKY